MNDNNPDPPQPSLHIDPNTTPEGFVWSDVYCLGYTPMDETHEEMIELTRAVIDACDETAAERFAALRSHTEEHFAEENRWMEESDFPPRQCHIDEHDAVLSSMRQVTEHLQAGGDVEMARDICREVARWFPGHADYLDSALAHWMVKRSTGGKPIVFHRL